MYKLGARTVTGNEVHTKYRPMLPFASQRWVNLGLKFYGFPFVIISHTCNTNRLWDLGDLPSFHPARRAAKPMALLQDSLVKLCIRVINQDTN